jgi:dynein light chain Tctex-type 1
MADEALGGLSEDELVDDAEVDTLIREAIVTTIGDSQFSSVKINSWSTNIIETCLKRLTAMAKCGALSNPPVD